MDEEILAKLARENIESMVDYIRELKRENSILKKLLYDKELEIEKLKKKYQ
ncbi:MAG: hypothetical protein ACE5K0_08280 [Candidatus Methanofastidiosia archaeon]